MERNKTVTTDIYPFTIKQILHIGLIFKKKKKIHVKEKKITLTL